MEVRTDKDRIRKIVLSRLSFMIECDMDEDLKQDFYKNPLPYMRRHGQKIPENAKTIQVEVDAKGIRWPSVTIFFPQPVVIEGKPVWAVQYDEALDIQRMPDMSDPASVSFGGVEGVFAGNFDFEPLETLPEAMLGAIDFSPEGGAAYKMKPKRGLKVKRLIPFPIEECGVYIKMPFVDIDADILEEIKFDDGEIVLTSCT